MHYHKDSLSWRKIERRCISQAFGEKQKRYTQILDLNYAEFDIISLDDLRLISKVGYCTFYKVNCAVAALFTIWINESFS